MSALREGSLFSGYNGLGLGVEAALAEFGFELTPAWFVEVDPGPSAILDFHYPDVPNHGDITTVDWSSVEPVDVLTGGFPWNEIICPQCFAELFETRFPATAWLLAPDENTRGAIAFRQLAILGSDK